MVRNSPLKKSLCRRGRVIVAEDKARDRRASLDSGRERLPAAGRQRRISATKAGRRPDGLFQRAVKDFINPARSSGHGVRVKNLYNLYVYFWRWALWKVFENDAAEGPGIVSFISASSYIDGDAFCGMREHMRRICDEIWILDLGGEGRGTNQSENVFAIQTPVTIAVAFRATKTSNQKPARVWYTQLDGTREEKLSKLDEVEDFGSAKLEWQKCPDNWHARFRPAGNGEFFSWPLLTEVMPWQHSGVQLKRKWPIAPDDNTLEHRWRGLLAARDRSGAFRGTGDREVDGTYRVLLTEKDFDSTPISELSCDAPIPEVQPYAYRTLDRHCIIADGRLMSRPRPDLWRIHSQRQVYLTTLFSQPLGEGPALTCSAHVPDLDHFRGSYGAKAVIPLFRNSNATNVNFAPTLLDILSREYQQSVKAEDLLAYVYGTLAQPEFTKRLRTELQSRELRVPITKDPTLFKEVQKVGGRLLWLQTYGERFTSKDQPLRQIPPGSAKCNRQIPGDASDYPESFEYIEATRTLQVGKGEFAPVDYEVYNFEVSGLKVLQSWLKYRMKKGKGAKSSPLDYIRPERWTSQFTTELLHLLWVLEATVEVYPEQARLLDEIIVGECFSADELPAVPEEMRKPPKAQKTTGDLFYDAKG